MKRRSISRRNANALQVPDGEPVGAASSDNLVATPVPVTPSRQTAEQDTTSCNPSASHLPFANQFLSPSKLQYESNGAQFSVWNHLTREMFGWGAPGTFKPSGKGNILNFLVVPFELECFLSLGLWICLDSFLYILTFLPLRIVLGGMSLLQELLLLPWTWFLPHKEPWHIFPRFHRTQGFDLMRGLMLATAVMVLQYINMSKVYHFIRGQSMIKLYVLMGMLEVLDKLLCSFGQDVFDSLHNAVRRAPVSIATTIYLGVALLYVSMHAAFYFCTVASYMVVVNSADEALVTVLVLNNFSELRAFVFKKFDANNLFQCACSDISERFQILLFLAIIVLVTIAQQDSPQYSLYDTFTFMLSSLWQSVAPSAGASTAGTSAFSAASEIVSSTVFSEAVEGTIPSASSILASAAASAATIGTTASAAASSLVNHNLLSTLSSMQLCMWSMLLGEAIADSLKHAFMNKFNSINAAVYRDFAFILRSDLLNARSDPIVLDHTYSVTRRLGLAQIPLAAVFLRYMILAGTRWAMVHQLYRPAPTVDSVSSIVQRSQLRMWLPWVQPLLTLWLVLVVVKILLGLALVVYADHRQQQDVAMLYARTPLEQDRLREEVEAAREQGFGPSSVAHSLSTVSIEELVQLPPMPSLAEDNSTTHPLEGDERKQLRAQARQEFIDKLASMERYTVYNGRII